MQVVNWEERVATRQYGAASRWRQGILLAVGNAVVFLLCAFALFAAKDSNPIQVALAVPLFFFAGSAASFILLMRGGGGFAALAWYILGAGLYFGLGVFVGAMSPDENIYFLSDSGLYEDLIRVNLLNACSVILVLTAALVTSRLSGHAHHRPAIEGPQIQAVLLATLPVQVLLVVIGVVLQLLTFPVPTDYLTRTYISVIHMFVPLFFLTIVVLWPRLDRHWAVVGAVVYIATFLVALLSFSKFAVMSLLIVVVAGSWFHRPKLGVVVIEFVFLGMAFISLSNIVTTARSHFDYDASRNTPYERASILIETIGEVEWNRDALFARDSRDSGMPISLMRFDMFEIQSYLMNEYDEGRPGSSLKDFWVALVPRVLWPDKPNVTRFGGELYQYKMGAPDAASALAPSYSGEAYWNYGPQGVAWISVLIGWQIGWMTRRWQVASRGGDPAFYLIAFPVALWAVFVETWIAASYIGGFVTLIVLWLAARVIVRKVPRRAAIRGR
jgi:hypothetical protein